MLQFLLGRSQALCNRGRIAVGGLVRYCLARCLHSDIAATHIQQALASDQVLIKPLRLGVAAARKIEPEDVRSGLDKPLNELKNVTSSAEKRQVTAGNSMTCRTITDARRQFLLG